MKMPLFNLISSIAKNWWIRAKKGTENQERKKIEENASENQEYITTEERKGQEHEEYEYH